MKSDISLLLFIYLSAFSNTLVSSWGDSFVLRVPAPVWKNCSLGGKENAALCMVSFFQM